MATFSKTESDSAADELAHYIGSNPYAYAKLAASYKVKPAKNHAEAIAQALLLAQKQPDFVTRFEKEVATARHFNIGRLFAAILTGGASEIAIRIAQAIAKAKAARQAAAAQQQQQGQPTAPAAVVADPVAAVAAAPTPEAAAAVGKQAMSLHTGAGAGKEKPKAADMWHKHKNKIIAGLVLLFVVGVGIYLGTRKSKPAA